jgi:tetratricopeptide (TPR) repeat protein
VSAFWSENNLEQGILFIVNSRSNSPSRRIPLLWIVLLGTFLAAAAQVPRDSIHEMQSRLDAVARARQSGDPEQVAAATRNLIGFALLQMADLRASEVQFLVAIELYKQAIGFDDAPGIHLPLGIAYASVGAADDALRESQAAVAADPKSAVAWNLRGRMFSAKKEYQSAVECYEKSLALHDDIEVSYSLATALINLHKIEEANAVFKKMELTTGNRARIHIMAGRAYEGAGMSAEAEREYKTAIAIDPKASRGHYFLGLFYLVKNSWEPSAEAKREFQAEVAVNPKDFFGNYFLGYLASVEKKYGESDTYLKIATAAKPDWPEPFLYMGLNAYGAGSDSNAELLLRKAIKLTGADESRNNYQVRRAYFTLGRILIREGKRDEGTALIKKSREMETTLLADARQQQALSSREIGGETPTPDQPVPARTAIKPVERPEAPLSEAEFSKLNLTPLQKTQLKAAEKQFRSILGSAYNDLGTSEARHKEFASALAHFQAAERWAPETPGLMRNAGLAAFLSENYAESTRALRVVVAADPSDKTAQAMLAMSLFSVKDYPAAAKAFDKVPEAAMSDPRMTYGWAASLARTNDRARASKILGQFTAQPLPVEMLVQACQLYVEMQDNGSAQSCFAKAKAQDPTVKVPN